MTQQIINVGTAPNAGNGDPDRTAWQKTNANFTELYATAGIATSVSVGGTSVVGGTPGHVLTNNSGVLGDLALAASATTDTTNATNITSGTLPAARLPAPTASTLGGVKSYTAVPSQWINAISTVGTPSSTQPAFSDISGVVAKTQLPIYRGSFTLPANSTSYTVNAGVSANAANCVSTSAVVLVPQTPDAALQAAFVFAVAGTAQFVVTCASNPNTDMTFLYLLFV